MATLVALGDFHFQKRWFAFVTDLAAQEKHDAICLAGDFLNMHPNEKVPLNEQVEWVLDWFAKLPTGRTKIFGVTGNHDFFEGEINDPNSEGKWLQRARRPGIAVDGDVTALGAMNFVCLPWIGAIDSVIVGPAVVLAHAPPEGTDVARCKGWDTGGDFSVRLAAETLWGSNSIFLSGHCHTADAWVDYIGSVACFNPGADFNASQPNRVVIDTIHRRARLFNAQGAHGPLRF